MSCANGCSGETTKKVAPSAVSGLVVKTSIPSNFKSIPSDLPIQLFCASLTCFGQSTKGFCGQINLSANSVIFKNHCSTSFWTTSVPHLQHFPTSIFSLATTVLHEGHQLDKALPLYASPFSNIFKN